ncbi:MAG: sulfatase-like hydrolase/transferase [Pirellulales bacterium]|nr:sulfatase-like hydrolase/transferase [Pirellulales bacterium]
MHKFRTRGRRLSDGLSIALIAWGLLVGLSAESRAVDRPPNIVLIMADDLGYECLGADGGTSYKTPVLDRLAAEGARFEHCYSQPLCTPSRVKLMTGMYNARNYVRFGMMDRNQTTFAQLLKQAGYVTCVAGKWQLGNQPDSPRHFGFDESCLWQHMRGRTKKSGHDSRYPNPSLEINGREVDYTHGEYGPDVVSDFACDFMERHRDKPFLVYYPMILTHCPFVPTPDSTDWDPKSPGPLRYKGDSPKYYVDMVAYMDKLVGKVVAKLEELGLRENTLVLFTGDNGTDQPIVSIMNGRKVAGGKRYMTDAGTHVPLVANWPGTIPKGQLRQELVDFSDFLPTLCEATGTPVPERLKIDGRSFLPKLLDKEGTLRQWTYCWYSRNGQMKHAREFARNQRYKLYRTGEFYDVANDMLEKRDLGDQDLDAETTRARAVLQKALDQYENARPARLKSRGKS